MHIPKDKLLTDRREIIAFIKKFSFGTVITVKDKLPVATHLPFLISERDNEIILTSHFAKVNSQWKNIECNKSLVIFTEPHAYISPQLYETEINVPTWNYVAIHAYGQCKIIKDEDQLYQILEKTIDWYEIAYKLQWDRLPHDYKTKMIKGIVVFEIKVDEIQAKEKLSQNKTVAERFKIMSSLEASGNCHERQLSEYMKINLKKAN